MTLKIGTRKIKFGICRNARSMLAYAKHEGFVIMRATCQKCGHRWSIIARPERLPRVRRGESFLSENESCIDCGHDVVFAKKV